MTPKTVYTITFSPTSTSRKIATAIAEAMRCDTRTPLDATYTSIQAILLPTQSVALFVVPVYGGHVAPEALRRLEKVRGDKTPAVVVVVYGNRAFGDAAIELARFVTERGFIPVAAAAFIGEHSYSTSQHPIAAQRPNADDLAQAAAFGGHISAKLTRGNLTPVDAAKLRAPRTPLLSTLRFVTFVLGYRRHQKRNPVVVLPIADAGRCTHCSRCAAKCPVQAIARGNELETDPMRCIRCNACVKICPTEARSFATPFAAVLARNFARPKPPVTRL